MTEESKTLRNLLESIIQGVVMFDSSRCLVAWNQHYEKNLQFPDGFLEVGMSNWEMLLFLIERGDFGDGDPEKLARSRLDLLWGGSSSRVETNLRGATFDVLFQPMRDGGLVITYTDITDLKNMELAIKENEKRFRDFAEAAADWFWEMDADLRFTYMSENVDRILGVAPEWHYGKTREELLKDDHDRATWADHLRTLRARRPFRNFDYMRVGEGVEPRWLRTSGMPIFADDGTFKGYRGTASDITEQKLAEENLRASELRLLRAQKMEAVGQLTGGVAHDFNNLLAVIHGNAELLARKDGTAAALTGPILRAAKRGSELTQRLLAFSRQQPLLPQVLDLGGLVSGMSDLLSRTLGEIIEVETVADPDLWSASADPGQVESALLNLALNARDAMPGGGRLTIECSNARLDEAYAAGNHEASAGDYVVLAVSDTGVGMTEEVKAHAFEPFFTTKDVGKGSGLGLSTVYGFAKQSQGHAAIYSEDGHGTTVKLYLPRTEAALARPEARPDEAVPQGGGEVVLVIEDDPDVRALAARMLLALDYQVIDVPDAAAAQKMLSGGTMPDLVLSDVVLPGGTSGPEFAKMVRRTHPGLKIIFMSGYPAEAAKRSDFLDLGQVLLNKPFQMDILAKALREALDRRSEDDR